MTRCGTVLSEDGSAALQAWFVLVIWGEYTDDVQVRADPVVRPKPLQCRNTCMGIYNGAQELVVVFLAVFILFFVFTLIVIVNVDSDIVESIL